ncbi:MAG TPA: DUF4367 domain-containing protein [Clostridiales bacterium]|nr:DUF4367 domain-containing protein [Clostridiales bacterium]
MIESMSFDEKLKRALYVSLDNKLENLPTFNELDNIHDFSPKFKKKINKLIRIHNKPYYRIINTAGKRVALFIITIIISLMATVLSVEALRNGFYNFIMEIYEKFAVVFVDKNAPSQINAIEETYYPEYIPEGFSLATSHQNIAAVTQIYKGPGNGLIIYEQFTINAEFSVDIENDKYTEIEVNGFSGYHFYEKEINNMIWQDGKYVYILKSTLGKDEMIKIAESLKVKTS